LQTGCGWQVSSIGSRNLKLDSESKDGGNMGYFRRLRIRRKSFEENLYRIDAGPGFGRVREGSGQTGHAIT
jgi:hypothetical protein